MNKKEEQKEELAPNGSIRVDAEGNTRTSASKYWCFTWNNYWVDWLDYLTSNLKDGDKYIFGKEIGESGTPHIQGFIKFMKKTRPMERFGIKLIHWEKCKGSEFDNVNYCKYDDDWVSNFVFPPYTIELKLYDWQKDIVKIIDEKPDDRTINWFWEEKGNIGKTIFCKWVFTHYENTIVLSGKANDMKNGIVEYKKNTGRLPRIIILDIPRTTLDFLSYTGIEEVKNMFFYSGKYEGGMVCGENPHLICFANEPPDSNKLSLDRWNIVNIRKDSSPKEEKKINNVITDYC